MKTHNSRCEHKCTNTNLNQNLLIPVHYVYRSYSCNKSYFIYLPKQLLIQHYNIFVSCTIFFLTLSFSHYALHIKATSQKHEEGFVLLIS